MFLRTIEAILGVGLLAQGIVNISVQPHWWAYVPTYMVSALLAIFQMPRNSTWRTLSSLSIVAGGLYTSFLLWTFTSVRASPTLQLEEARNLPSIALGALLISFIRLTNDKISQPIQYLRSSIILIVAIISLYAIINSYYLLI